MVRIGNNTYNMQDEAYNGDAVRLVASTQPSRRSSGHHRPQIGLEPAGGYSDASQPGMIRSHKSNLSELARINEFISGRSGHIRSPSGNELDREQFLRRQDRPLTIEERQAKIKERVRLANEQEAQRIAEVKHSTEQKREQSMQVPEKTKKKSGLGICWSCFIAAD